MKLLLDTHTLIWYTEGNPLLPAPATAQTDEDPSQCVVSIATLWEIGIKHSTGKLRLGVSVKAFLDAAVQGNGFVLPQVTPSHITALAQLPFHHRDPFDRMLIAQACTEGLTIISRDAVLDLYGVKRKW